MFPSFFIPSIISSVSTASVTETAVSSTGPFAWDPLEENDYLLADHHGLLSVLRLPSAADRQLSLLPLGHHSATSVVRYIDNRVLYAGSYSGPSRLLRITPSGLEVIAEYANVGPIVDMAARQGETMEATQLLGVGGYDATSALLEIRSGVECQVLSEEKEEVRDVENENENENENEDEKMKMKMKMKMSPTYLGFYPSISTQTGEDRGERNQQDSSQDNLQGVRAVGDWSAVAGELVVSYPTRTQFYEVQPTQYGLLDYVLFC